MNASSAAVFAAVVALAALAAWRTFKKGAPCECGGCSGRCSRCACAGRGERCKCAQEG